MNLTIDIGNTRSKIVLFCNDQVQEAFAVESDLCEAVQKVMQTYDIQAVAWSAVGRIPEGFEAMLSTLPCPVARLEWHSPIAFNRKYQTPEGMGADRIAADIAAVAYSPGHNVLVIDAGTCITYDLLWADGPYIGGNIAPGMQMRLRAMHDHTAALPLITPDGPLPDYGHDTDTAMRCGVVWGMRGEIAAEVERYRALIPNLKVWLTGGDELNLADYVKGEVNVDRYLVAKGLNLLCEEYLQNALSVQ
jgi:type III pantothenate kinase